MQNKDIKQLAGGETWAWMPMIGFDKDAPDKGVRTLLERMQFKPQAISAFLFHPDFVHHYRGLDTEYTLHPDNCSYYASPRNEERQRQEWTNLDVKCLVDRLNEENIQVYMGIMGVDIGDRYHKEWLSEHPELKQRFRNNKWSLNVLKRFQDGTWYEDFFADMVCRVLVDYGFAGLHVTDNFCPGGGGTDTNDYSRDMAEQFAAHTGVQFPEEIAALGDSDGDVARRADWIWEHQRQSWIGFYAWRWEQFWKKLCQRLHSVGKKVFVIGMYCTDPFMTLYHKGVDLRRIVKAGVDYLMPNMAASGSAVGKDRPWRFFEQATMIPLADVFTDAGGKINMLGVKDGTEEWDMLHHAPTLLERDIYYLPSWFRYTPQGLKRCLDGFIVCLADGIYKDEWQWLRERFAITWDQTPRRLLLPTVVWSDDAMYNTLPEFIRHRRWTLHKFLYELAKAGYHTGGMVRTEHLTDACGDLFVPNFDLLNTGEKKKIASYRGGAVICTASAEKPLELETYGIKPEIFFEDPNSCYKNCAFAFNMEVEDREELLRLLQEDDGSPCLADPMHVAEVSYPYLRSEVPFQKVSVGFIKALGSLLKAPVSQLVESTLPVLPMEMPDGAIRIYGINDDRLHYGSNMVTFHKPIREVKNISAFPMLPVKFTDSAGANFTASTDPEGKDTFKLLIPQGGISIVDVYLK